jgi:hypothetical protein
MTSLRGLAKALDEVEREYRVGSYVEIEMVLKTLVDEWKEEKIRFDKLEKGLEKLWVAAQKCEGKMDDYIEAAEEVIEVYAGMRSGAKTKTIIISNPGEYGEYRVPGPKGKEEAGAYYTNDRGDAIATAKLMYGEEVEIRFRGRRR